MAGTTSTLPIDKLIGVNVPSTTPAPATTANQLGEDAFLKLLTTQIANQDPLSPMDNTQTVAQLAQFSALQSTNELKTSFKNFQSNFSVLQSASLIGKTCSAQYTDANNNTSTVQGTIKSVSVINGSPEFTLVNAGGSLLTDASGNPLQIPTANILSIGQ